MNYIYLHCFDLVYIWQSVVIKSMERNVANIYEARRLLTGADTETSDNSGTPSTERGGGSAALSQPTSAASAVTTG
jgi:hypothetical protein